MINNNSNDDNTKPSKPHLDPYKDENKAKPGESLGRYIGRMTGGLADSDVEVQRITAAYRNAKEERGEVKEDDSMISGLNRFFKKLNGE
jgi:hypothetical protein